MSSHPSKPLVLPGTVSVLLVAIVVGVLVVLLVARRPGSDAASRPHDAAAAAQLTSATVVRQREEAPLLEVRRQTRATAPATAMPAAAAAPEREAFREREFLAVFRSAHEAERFRKAALAAGLEVMDSIAGLNAVGVRLSDDVDLYDLLDAAGLEAVSLEQNAVVYLPSNPTPATTTPGKTVSAGLPFGSSALDWLGGASRAETWGKGVRVAVLDTGIDAHAALAGVTMARIDLVGDTGTAGDWAGHGTGVATLLAGNSKDVQGVAPGVDILAYRVLDASGTGDTFTVARGIVAAVDAGAQIINLSLGTPEDSYVLQQAVQYAADHGVILVAACGNDGEAPVTYPARYDGVVAVTAIDATGSHVAFASSGAEVDIAAPGSGVNAGWTGGTTVALSGTSAAAPFVTGALAGLLSEDATMTAAQALSTLLAHADDQGYPGQDALYGSGVLDLERLRTRSVPGLADLAVTDFHVDQTVGASGLVALLVGIQNRGNTEISGGVLELTINGETRSDALATLALNESGSVRAYVSRSQLEQQGSVTVQARASLTGLRDVRPGNNLLRTTIVLRAAAP